MNIPAILQGADALGTFVVQTSSHAPANAQVLASLPTGLVKVTTATGVLSTAAAGTDYLAPNGSGAALTGLTGSQISGNITGNAASITGSVAESQVTGLVSDLAAKAPLASPALTGTPTAPTATAGTNTTQIATCAFVLANAGSGAVSSVAGRTGAVVLAESDVTGLVSDLSAKAPLASPAFTGGVTVAGSATGYTGGEVKFSSTASGAIFGLSTVATGSPTMYFDHLAGGNTGGWAWRNNAGGSQQMALSGTGTLTLNGGLTTGAGVAVAFSGGVDVTGGPDGYNGELRFPSAGSGAICGIASLATGAGRMYFDQRASTSADWQWRGGPGGTPRMTLDANGRLGANTGTPGAHLHATADDAAKLLLITQGVVGQTAAHWTLQGRSSTTDGRTIGVVDGVWASSTDASRKGRLLGYAADSTGTNREGWRVESDGTQPLLGFYGASAVAKAASPGTASGTDAAVINAVITALRNLGLIT